MTLAQETVDKASSSSSSTVTASSKTQLSTPLDDIHFALSYRGQTYPVQLSPSSTLESLHDAISEKTGVLPIHQKIVAPAPLKKVFANVGSSSTVDTDAASLEKLGFTRVAQRNTVKLLLVGPKQDEVESVRREDDLGAKMNRPRQYHPSMLRGGKPRTTTTATSEANLPFHTLRVHHATPPSSPEYETIMSRLRQLSTDEAVLHVCRLHGFRVGELTELLPHEHPNLLGLNTNMGQRISLRLRTDRYDGLRPYRDTRQVLLHELAHNKVTDHPPEFKILNSELNAQVEAFEHAKKQGTHRLIDGDVYVPPDDANALSNGAAAGPTAYVLGGEASSGTNDDGRDALSRRDRVLQATMKRLEKVEADIERGCGSAS